MSEQQRDGVVVAAPDGDVDVQVAGHVCLDLAPTLPGPASTVPGHLAEVGPMRVSTGGCLGNTGRDLRDLGLRTRLVTSVGDDALGGLLASLLRTEHPEGLAATVVAGGTTSYSVVVEPPGLDRTFWHHVGANAGFDGSRVDPAAAPVLHLGYLPLLPALAAQGGRPLAELLSRCRAASTTTSLDLCVVDPRSAPVDWPAVLAAALPGVDVVSPSLDDLRSTGLPAAPGSAGALTAADGAAWLVERGAAVAVVTDASRGMAVRTAPARRFEATPLLRALPGGWHDRRAVLPSCATSVVATTGAGDAVSAALLAALVAGHDLDDALVLVALAAAHRVGGLGPLPPLDHLSPMTGRRR